jgi:ribonuclease Z
MLRLLSLAVVVACFHAAGVLGADSDFRVTLLGTASPSPRPDRFGPSTLVEAGSVKLLVDAGRGVPIRLWQMRVPMGKIDALLITHYHSDHVSGVPDVWLTGWLQPPFGQRKTPFYVIGPTGAKELMDNLQRAYAADVRIRIADEKNPPEGIAVRVDEFAADGVVFDRDGVRVTAFEVNHGDVIKPAYGYRIDYRGRSVVISGDTRFNENVIKYGAGADLLIHELGAAKPELLKNPAMQRIIDHHTTPRDVGRVFERAKPRLAVYTHIVRLSNATIPEPTLAEILAETRETYAGPLVFGEDLMTFDVSERGVAVYRSGGP